MNIAEKFIYLGRVSAEEKINLLRSSLLYIQPTLAEGFGMAILEAQSCGTPVITTFKPCINEIFSNTVVQAIDIFDLSLKIELLSNSRILYDKYVKLGIENSFKYSFEKRRANIKLLVESLN